MVENIITGMKGLSLVQLESKFLSLRNFVVVVLGPKNLNSKILDQKNEGLKIESKIFLGPKTFGLKKIRLKKLMVQKECGPKY